MVLKTIMNKEEKKKYILSNWNVSSGKRITAMLIKYWELGKKVDKKDIIETAEEIFEIKVN